MKYFVSFIIASMLIPLTLFAQDDERGEIDAVGFFTVNGTLLSTQFYSTDELFTEADASVGYELGISYYLVNDVNYDQFFARFSLDFSRETTEAGVPINYGSTPVISKGNFSFLGLSIFGAYRFSPQNRFNPYLGGGIFSQVRVNSTDDAFRFVTEDGEEFPVFTTSDPNAPIKYRRKGPGAINFGLIAETGAFIWTGKKWITVGLGLNYAFFPRIAAAQKIGKMNLYAKIGYELF